MSAEYEMWMRELQETHRQEQETFQRAQIITVEWLQTWPNHCKVCFGWGGFVNLGGRDEPPGFNECPATEEKPRLCHRCGVEGLTEDGAGACTACGWSFDDGEPWK